MAGERSRAVSDRATGAVLGSAAGDALGAGYEFTNPGPDREIAMKGGGGFGWAPGEWTDDTQMAVAILDVIATGSSDLDAIASNFLTWYAAGPADVGNQTRSVLGSAAIPEDLAVVAVAFMDANPEAAGNGALMRTAPVALTALDDRTEIARLAGSTASLTHAHPDSVARLCSLVVGDPGGHHHRRTRPGIRLGSRSAQRPRTHSRRQHGEMGRTHRRSCHRPPRSVQPQRLGCHCIPGRPVSNRQHTRTCGTTIRSSPRRSDCCRPNRT